jgi:hypothetical protein
MWLTKRCRNNYSHEVDTKENKIHKRLKQKFKKKDKTSTKKQGEHKGLGANDKSAESHQAPCARLALPEKRNITNLTNRHLN